MKRKIVLGLLLAALGAPAFAGVTFRQVTKVEGEKTKQDMGSEFRVWADGGNAKMEFTKVGMSPMFKPGAYMLVKGEGKEIYFVNPEEKTYAKMDLESMTGMFGSAMQSMEQMGMKIEIQNPKMEKLLEEDGGTVAGYPTRHARYRTGYTMLMNMPMGMKMTTVSDSVEDVWVTSALPLAFVGKSFSKLGSSKMLADLEKLVEMEKAKVGGFPLKRIVETSSNTQGPMGMGGPSKTKTTTEVLELKEAMVPGSMFEIPVGYRQTELAPPPPPAGHDDD